MTTYSKLATFDAISLRRRYKRAVSPVTRANRRYRREQREIYRRIRAAEKIRLDYKSKTQRERELNVKLGRAEKMRLKNYLALRDDEGIYSQSGFSTLATSAAALSVACSAVAGGVSAVRAATAVKSAAEVVEGTLTEVGSVVASATSPISYVKAKLIGAADYFKRMFGAWWLAPAVIMAMVLCLTFAHVHAVIIAAWDICATWLGDSAQYLRSFFQVDAVPQSGTIDLSSFIVTLAACLFVPKRDPSAMVGEMMRRVGQAEKCASGFTFLFENSIKYLEKVVNSFASLFTERRVAWTDQLDRMLTAWAAKVDAFEEKSLTSNPSIPELQDAMRLLQEGIGFRQTVRTTYNVVFLNKYIDRLTGAIQAHRGALVAANAFRMQPICSMFGGGSGVGKTTVLKWVAAATMLLTEAVPHDEVLNNMWQKGISEYWNGYVQQFVYIMDDCFQQKTDGKTLDNDAMFMIRAVGNWAFPLNFADLDSKGRFYFMSSVILGSTNVANIENVASNCVMEPKAVTRRIQYGYWISVNPIFANPDGKTLDYKKVALYMSSKRAGLGDSFTVEQLLDCIPWHAWRLMPHSFDKTEPNYVQNDTTLLDVVKMMSEDYLKRKSAHDAEVADLDAWTRDLASCIKKQSGLGEILLHSDSESEDERTIKFGHLNFSANGTPTLYTWTTNPLEDEFALQIEDFESRFQVPKPEKVESPRPPTKEELEEQRGRYYRDRYKSVAEREMWLDCACRRMAEWCRQKNLPSFCSDLCEVLGFDPNLCPPELEGMKGTAAFLKVVLRCGILSIVFKGIVELTRALFSVLSKAFSSVFPMSQSNIRSEVRATRGSINFPRIRPQLGNPPKDIQGEIAFGNTYKLSACMSDGEELGIGQVLFIEGDLAVMPHHFRADIEGKRDKIVKLRMRSCLNPKFDLEFSVGTLLGMQHLRVPNVDVEFYKFDIRAMKAHRSITHLFLTENALRTFFRNSANHVRLDIARVNSAGDLTRTTLVSNVCEYLAEGAPIVGMGTLQGIARYDAPTVNGDCGAPLSICEPRYYGGSSLIGIHVAGKVGLLARSGYASVLSREMVYEARTELGTWVDNFAADVLQRGVKLEELTPEERDGLSQCGLLGGSFLPLYKVDKPLHLGKDSKIKASPIQEDQLWGPAPQAPAPLGPVYRDGVRVEPMAVAMSAYQAPMELRDLKLPTLVVQMAMRKHWEATVGYDTSILTFEEAVVPPESMKMKSLQRRSSSGYPYRLDGTVGKTDFFGVDGDFTFTSEACADLRGDVEKMIEAAKRNERSSVIFTDFLKDELRPLAKVEAVATRAISGAPLDYVIAVRMYFGAFMAAMFATSVRSGMAPGINPYTDWHVLAEELLKHGGKVFGGDFKRFDASQQPYVFQQILDYINRWYRRGANWRAEDEQVRNILWLDLVHSRHLTGVGGKLEYILQWNKSLPSGHPLTTPVNSMYSLITLTFCYVELTGDTRNMWDHVFINTFGDDNINAVDDATSEVFNQETVSQCMAEMFGMTYTSDKKDSALKPYEAIEEVTFLKRTFARDGEGSGGWVAPLDPNSFLYTPYWFKNPRDLRGDLNRNVEQMLGELCLHPPSEWEKYFGILQEWYRKEGLVLPFQSRTEAREWVMSRSDAWY